MIVMGLTLILFSAAALSLSAAMIASLKKDESRGVESRDEVIRWGRREVLFFKLFGVLATSAFAIFSGPIIKSTDLPFHLAVMRSGVVLFLLIVLVWKGCDRLEKEQQKLEDLMKKK